ncbi:MAG: hypothetical protein Q8S00_09770 [Deltaproteobacteria bacterium]|nr:hypothetical protein [Deltaproteobacteria bacterium]
MPSAIALMLSLVMLVAAAGTAHINEGMDEIPVIIVLAQEGPTLYDPYASEDEYYPQPIPVRLLRGNSTEKWLNVLKARIGMVSPEGSHRRSLHPSASSQQSFYHRQEVLRI